MDLFSSRTGVAGSHMINLWSILPYELFLVIADTVLGSAEEAFRPNEIIWRLAMFNTSRVNPDRTSGELGVILGRDESARQKAFVEQIRAISQVNQTTRATFRRSFSPVPVASVLHCHPRPPATPRCVWASNKATFLFDIAAMTIHQQTPSVIIRVSTCFEKVERLATASLHDLLSFESHGRLLDMFPGVKTFSFGALVGRVPRPAVPHDHDDMMPLLVESSLLVECSLASSSGFPREAGWYRDKAPQLMCLRERGVRILGYGHCIDPWSAGPTVSTELAVPAEPMIEVFPSSAHGLVFKFLDPRCDCYLPPVNEEDSEDESEDSEDENDSENEDEDDNNQSNSQNNNNNDDDDASIDDVD